jgi:protein TonB
LSVHDGRVSYATSQSFELTARAHRAGVAIAIIIAHAAVVYAVLNLGPVMYRVNSAPVVARFIDVSTPEQRWTPPTVTPIDVVLDVSVPLAPEIEVPVEMPPTAKQIVAQPMPIAPPAPHRADAVPKLISTVEYVREPIPRYPPQSRRLREQGLVVLRVLIDEKGQACDIEVESSSGHSRLDHAAKEAVAGAAFRPYVEDGEPRRALVLIPIEFSLSGRV